MTVAAIIISSLSSRAAMLTPLVHVSTFEPGTATNQLLLSSCLLRGLSSLLPQLHKTF